MGTFGGACLNMRSILPNVTCCRPSVYLSSSSQKSVHAPRRSPTALVCLVITWLHFQGPALPTHVIGMLEGVALLAMTVVGIAKDVRADWAGVESGEMRGCVGAQACA